MNAGIILYGAPASGKDTVTRALTALDERYQFFPRLKSGPGRTAGYRMTTSDQVDALRARGDVIWENHRYGSVYVIDRPELADRLTRHVPVLHLGQVDAIDAVRTAGTGARWLVVWLHCPRTVAAARIEARATGDTPARLHAWDETAPLPAADLVIDTADVDPHQAATTIHQAAATIHRAIADRH